MSDRYEILVHGEGGARTTLICGAVRFDHPAARNLVSSLPATIHVEASSSPQAEWLQSTLRLMAAEARELRPGGEEVITRLADILVIQAIRSWIETDPAARSGWLGALQDRQIGRAISLIHREPAREWTVASLAREIAMSRSALAARFTELVGEPVMQYVTRWRMHLALSALREEGVTVAELANRLGYRSEAAFSRAFKRVVGVPPGAVRRSAVPAQLKNPRPDSLFGTRAPRTGPPDSGPVGLIGIQSTPVAVIPASADPAVGSVTSTPTTMARPRRRRRRRRVICPSPFSADVSGRSRRGRDRLNHPPGIARTP